MSETDDTEELIINNSKLYTKKSISSNNIIQDEEEITKINTVELISDLLKNICEENKKKKIQKSFLIKYFINKNIPSISIKDYLIRLTNYSKINESTIIIVLIYIDRITKLNHFLLTYNNIHKLILAAFILAIKYNEDIYYSMSIYSKIGGVTLSELNKLELEFIKLIGFDLFIQQKLYDKYYNDLMSLKSESEDYEEDYENSEEDLDNKIIEKDIYKEDLEKNKDCNKNNISCKNESVHNSYIF